MNEELMKILESILGNNTVTALRNAPADNAQNTVLNLLDEGEQDMAYNPPKKLEFATLLSDLTNGLPDIFSPDEADDDLSAEETMDEINRYAEYVSLLIRRIDEKTAANPNNAELIQMLGSIKETLNGTIKYADDAYNEYNAYLAKVQEAQVDYDTFANKTLENEKQKKTQLYGDDDFFIDEDASDTPEETAKERWLNARSEAYSGLTEVYEAGNVTEQMFSEIEEETAKQEAGISPLVKDIFPDRMNMSSSDEVITQIFDYYDASSAEMAEEKKSMWNTTRDFLKKYKVSLDNSDYSNAMENIIYRKFEYEEPTPERLRFILDFGRDKENIITDKMLDAVIDYYKQDEQRNAQNAKTDEHFKTFLSELAPIVKVAEYQTKKQILIVNADKKYSSQIHNSYRSSMNNCRKALIKSLSDLNSKTTEVWDEYETDIRNANNSYTEAYANTDRESKEAYDKAMARQRLEAENNIDVKIEKLLKDLDGTFKIGSNTAEYETFKKALKEAPMSNSYDNLLTAANAYIAAKTADGNTPSSSWGKTRLNAAQEIVNYIQEQQAKTAEMDTWLKEKWQQKLRDLPGKVPDELQVTRPQKTASENAERVSRKTDKPEVKKSSGQTLSGTNPLDKAKEMFAFVKLPDSVKYKELSVETVDAERYNTLREAIRLRHEAERQKSDEENRIEEEIHQKHLQREEKRRRDYANSPEGKEMARKAEEISVYGIDLQTRARRRVEYLQQGSSVIDYLIDDLWDAIDRTGNNTDRLPGTHRGHITCRSSIVEDMRNEFLPSTIARFLFNEYDTDVETSLNATEKIVNIIDDYITGDTSKDLGKIYSVIRNELFLPKDGKPAMIPGYDGVDRYDVVVETISKYIDDYHNMHQNTVCAPGQTPREVEEAALTNNIIKKYNNAVNSGILTKENAGALVKIATDPETTNHQRELLFFINDKDLINVQRNSKNPNSFKKAFSTYLSANARTPFRKDAKGADKKWIKDFTDYVERTKQMTAADPQLGQSIKKAMGMKIL